MKTLTFPDPTSGALSFQPSGLVFLPNLSRSAFLASQEGKSASINVANGRYVSYLLADKYTYGEYTWILQTFFRDEDLLSVELTLDSPPDAHGWRERSEELQKKDLQDHLLQSIYGMAQPIFSWGRIVSFYDPRAGFSSIAVVYRDP
jgi:hypothetical protein